MTQQEVSGYPELRLLDAIQNGTVPEPGLLHWNEWEKWRSTVGLRPTVKNDGVTTDNRYEAELWKSTMVALYGEQWRTALLDRDLPTLGSGPSLVPTGPAQPAPVAAAFTLSLNPSPIPPG